MVHEDRCVLHASRDQLPAHGHVVAVRGDGDPVLPTATAAPMTLLSPYALGFLALVPVIVLFYILRAQYERVPVPSTLLWRNVVRDTEGRPTWRSPMRSILLFLQILAAILGALALTRPATLGQTARNHILILDASSSMQANDVGPSRFEEAKRAAGDVIRGAQDGDTFALLRMGTSV